MVWVGLVCAGLVVPVRLEGQEPGVGLTKAEAAAARAEPDAKGVYRVGNGVSAPKLVSSVQPEFSEQERKSRLRATCTVSLVVEVDGTVGEVTIVRSIAEGQPERYREAARSMDGKVLEAVRQYRYKPALLEGKPVPVRIDADVDFRIF